MPTALSPRPSQRPEDFAAQTPFREGSRAALLTMLMTQGGDERITPGPDGRNPYGAPPRLAEGEFWFASSTASAISPRGWEAAAAALPQAFSGRGAAEWTLSLRERLLALLAPPGAEAVFCASGTHAEFAALVLARALDGALARPLTNILVSPTETGRGAPLAAAGKHFLGSAPFGPAAHGARVAGWAKDEIELQTLPLRDDWGAALTSDHIDARAENLVRAGVARGARVLLHVLDCSKTGLSGVTRQAATRLKAAFPKDCSIVVDACQLRCPPAQIRADLEAGFFVMVSGSKFAGGPAFSGALLAPPEACEALRRHAAIDWPQELGAHFAAHDWPDMFREKMRGPFGARANPGLGMRWEAALAEYEAFCALDPALAARATALFDAQARRLIGATAGLTLDEACGPEPRTILPIFSQSRDGAYVDAHTLLLKLRAEKFYLGQPVALGGADALRLCLSAPQIVDFALSVQAGVGEAAAFAPLAQQLALVFDAWGHLAAEG